MAKPTKKQREVLEKMERGMELEMRVYFKDINPSFWQGNTKVASSTVKALHTRGWIDANPARLFGYALTGEGRAAIGAPLA